MPCERRRDSSSSFCVMEGAVEASVLPWRAAGPEREERESERAGGGGGEGEEDWADEMAARGADKGGCCRGEGERAGECWWCSGEGTCACEEGEGGEAWWSSWREKSSVEGWGEDAWWAPLWLLRTTVSA